MKNVYLNAFQLHSNTERIGFALNSMQGLEYPTIRPSHYDRPGESGANVSNLFYGGRMITLMGVVYAETAALFQSRRRDFLSAITMIRDSYSTPVPITLKMTTIDDLAVQIDCHIEDFQMKSQEINFQEFMLQLFAPNPELVSQTLEEIPIAKGAPGGVIIPTDFPMILAPNAGNSITITNYGTVQSWPEITLYGPLTNPVIQNDTLNRYIQLNYILEAGSQLVINMQNRTIIKDGVTNIIGVKSDNSRFWWLERGANLIRLITTNNTDSGSALVKKRNAFIGL